MRTLPADLTAPAVQAKTDEALRRVILEGKGEMPPFRRLLTDDEVRALIAHVRSLRRATP
jgi:mono/diheme cytochrome c family protein